MPLSVKMSVFSVSVLVAASLSAAEYVIEAPNGVGDVVALTNAIFMVNKGNNTGTKVLLKPGVYDLSGVQSMYGTGTLLGGAHLYFNTTCRNALIAGLGDGPGDVVLKGNGTLGIFHIWSTDASKPTVVSNLTVTGGSRNGDAGGIYGSSGGGLVLKNLIVTNNCATGLAGGVLRAKMYNCLIADNHSSGNKGGGFWSDTPDLGAVDCVFSNNTTATTGGGFYSSGEGGFLVGCKFYGNAAKSGSGAYMGGNGFVTNCLFKGNGPNVAANSDKLGGGLYLSSGECVDCDFIENNADRGGGAYVSSNSAIIRDCLFDGNIQKGWASGAALFVNASNPLALVSNCVFNANVTRSSSQTVISNAELVDCVITNHHDVNGYLLAGCNMTRCLVAGNNVWGNGQNLDIATVYDGTTVYRTNINCIITCNLTTNGVNSITDGKTIVNCTYYGNHVDEGGSGANVIRNSAVYNTLIVSNRISETFLDVRNGGSSTPHFTNCVMSVVGKEVDVTRLYACKVSPFTFAPTADGGEYDIKKNSPAFNAGALEDWMLPLLGECDFARRPRVKYDAVDVGALECQFAPPFAVILR